MILQRQNDVAELGIAEKWSENIFESYYQEIIKKQWFSLNLCKEIAELFDGD
jgi:hypothetical protein